MTWFPCPVLGIPVELTDERARQIRRRHANVLESHLAEALASPGLIIRRPWRTNETLFVREVDDDREGTAHCGCGRDRRAHKGCKPAPALDRHGLHCGRTPGRGGDMGTRLTVEYDEVGDILYLDVEPPSNAQVMIEVCPGIPCERTPARAGWRESRSPAFVHA